MTSMTEHQPELIPQTNVTTTPEEQATRDEYRRRLAEYLKDPEFRAIEGFPIGTDEDILALSDPPYYTACPNPFLPEILSQWQQEREEIREKLGFDVTIPDYLEAIKLKAGTGRKKRNNRNRPENRSILPRFLPI